MLAFAIGFVVGIVATFVIAGLIGWAWFGSLEE